MSGPEPFLPYFHSPGCTSGLPLSPPPPILSQSELLGRSVSQVAPGETQISGAQGRRFLFSLKRPELPNTVTNGRLFFMCRWPRKASQSSLPPLETQFTPLSV